MYPYCASCNANICSSVCRCSSAMHLLWVSTWSSSFARSDLAWLRWWSSFLSRRDPLKFDGIALLNTKLLIRFPCLDENNALCFLSLSCTTTASGFSKLSVHTVVKSSKMHLRWEVGRLWYFRIRQASRPNLSKSLLFFGDKSTLIFFSNFIWISRISFDPWDSRKLFGLKTYGARVSGTLQVFTPEWFLMAQLVDWGSLEICVMYWLFSELLLLYRLCCVFLCHRRKSEWGRWECPRWKTGETTKDETCMQHTRWLDSVQTFLSHARCVCVPRLWAKLYCTDVYCEWVSCLQSLHHVFMAASEVRCLAMRSRVALPQSHKHVGEVSK